MATEHGQDAGKLDRTLVVDGQHDRFAVRAQDRPVAAVWRPIDAKDDPSRCGATIAGYADCTVRPLALDDELPTGMLHGCHSTPAPWYARRASSASLIVAERFSPDYSPAPGMDA